MSIAQALEYTDKQIFKRIPEERIRHIEKRDNEPIETTPFETKVFAENEEDRKILESVYDT